MKRSTKLKITSFLCLGLVLIGYNQCINPMAPSSTKSAMKFSSTSSTSKTSAAPNSNGMTSDQVRMLSIESFQKTVYPITRARCISCHGAGQTPLHASADPASAHNSLVDTFKIDFNNIPNSRMVLKLKNERHNCWGDCTANANEMLTQIAEWKRLIDEKAPTATETTNAVNGKLTTETRTVQELLNPDNALDTGTISLMAESGSLKTPMVKSSENGIGYIWAPEGNGIKTLTSVNAGLAFIPFKIANSDFYKVHMFVNAPDANSDSIFVKVAGSDTKEWHLKTITSGYQWREVTNGTGFQDAPFYITGGQSVGVELRQRDDGFKVSKIIITNDPNFNPNAVTALKTTISLPLNTLSGVSGSTFEIDIEDFDMYSYKLSNPRIKTSQDLFVKNLKVLVNGSFNPQHSTYTIVNKKVTSLDPVVSTFSMILLKDKGADYDHLSFSFEHIGTSAAPTMTSPTTPPTPPPTTPVVTKLSSVEGFKQTLYPILRTNCAGCHGATQPPLHADANVTTAHTNVVETGLVNFANIAASKISTKIKNNLHNCGGATACANLSADMEAKITIWKALSGK